jgi:RNA polymerase sigma-70 factor (ECF subfamily)
VFLKSIIGERREFHMHKTSDDSVFKHAMVEKYFDTVYRLAYSQTQDSHRADDVLQEVFLRYIKTDKDFENEEHIKAWLIRVTINCSKSTFTESFVKKTVPLTDDITFEIPEQEDIYFAVAKLPKKYRAVIHLFYYEDMPIKQIAKVLKTKESTIKSQLHRGREMLKSILEGGSEIEF